MTKFYIGNTFLVLPLDGFLNGWNSFRRSFMWLFSGLGFKGIVNSLLDWINKQTLSTIFDVFNGSTAINKLVSIVTLLGVFFAIIRIVWVIAQTFNINIEQQQSVNLPEYIKRMVIAFITLSIAPALIVNGFVLVTVISSSLINSGPGDTVSVYRLLQKNTVERYVNYNTYCYSGQAATHGLKAGTTQIQDVNKKNDRFVILGNTSQIGTDATGFSVFARNDGMTSYDAQKLNKALCMGGEITSTPDANSKLFKDWSVADGDGFPIKANDGSNIKVFPSVVMESVSFDKLSLTENRALFGGAKGFESLSEIAYGEGSATFDGMTKTGLALVLIVVQFLLFFQFLKDLFERIVDVFGAIFSVWVYAPSFISSTRNQMIGELVKRVASIYLTQMYAIVLLDIWQFIMYSDTGQKGFGTGIFLQIGLTYGFFKAMKKGNTSMQAFFDRSSSGDIISGGGKVVQDFAKNAAAGD